jgi:predicted dehydrogenase
MDRLTHIPHLDITFADDLNSDLQRYDVLLLGHGARTANHDERLSTYVSRGGSVMFCLDPADPTPLPDAGVACDPLGIEAEVRVLFQNQDHPLAVRLPDAIYVTGQQMALKPIVPDVETILYADWHYQHLPMLTLRRSGKGLYASTVLTDYAHPIWQQILYRLVRHLAGHAIAEPTIGIGILGYAPSVGQFHAEASQNTPGLGLQAVCDLASARIAQAQDDFPGIKTHTSTEDLLQDPAVDLVIIATPPNTHAALALQALEAGKHVVCEKPLAITRQETSALLEASQRAGLHLSCHQNRRWDADYRAIQQALAEGRLGELFYIETFVGGFHHPCGYWHSHAPISGGTAYDWGAHYLDWIVGLIPDPVVAVRGTRHKRVWHDVSNADQERIQVYFAGGQEAEFIHSDIAAARKPKWYLLGTQGALVGRWRDVTTYEIDPLVYFHQHDIPATEMTPDLVLHRRNASTGQILTSQLAIPPRGPYPFHHNLADHLLTGEPLGAPLKDSIKVVTILEAAAQSMANNGRTEDLNGI